MILAFFKQNNPFSFLLLSLIAIVLWLPAFLHPHDFIPQHSSLAYNLVISNASNNSYLFSSIAVLLLIAEAFLINYIFNENELSSKRTFLPALVYLALMSVHPTLMFLNCELISNFFILLAILKMFNVYRKDNANSEIFDSGFCLSIASAFDFQAIVLFPVLWIGLMIFRAIKLREWLILLASMVVTYSFVFTFYYCTNTTTEFAKYLTAFSVLSFKPVFDFNNSFYFPLIVGLFIVILSLLALQNSFINSSQKNKKNLLFIIWVFIFSILSLFVCSEFSPPYFSILAICLTFIIVNYLFVSKKNWWTEFLFFAFMVSILLNNFG